MQWRRPVLAQCREVLRGAIAFIGAQAVGWKDWVPFADHVVTMDFGQNGRRRDGSGQRVAVNDGLLRHLAIEAHSIDKKIIGSWIKLRNCLMHREARRMVDVDLIYPGGIDRRD